ncbi:hypothetical protein CDAR_111381 [Caerostris darwini]|uniref:Uncharacterized protein n=1 Tax=Caerostris darwini TaxID=1538125 RepID=A0AAV4UBY6_9ARAC|nr:hypothetical protein CDAR_111381 [Caerostris darwini]
MPILVEHPRHSSHTEKERGEELTDSTLGQGSEVTPAPVAGRKESHLVDRRGMHMGCRGNGSSGSNVKPQFSVEGSTGKAQSFDLTIRSHDELIEKGFWT